MFNESIKDLWTADEVVNWTSGTGSDSEVLRVWIGVNQGTLSNLKGSAAIIDKNTEKCCEQSYNTYDPLEFKPGKFTLTASKDGEEVWCEEITVVTKEDKSVSIIV